jgi:threonine/homoserine/homoserine lactone efflux protein
VPTTSNIIGFLLLSIVIILIPGPSVLYAIGRALVLGTKAAVLSVFGNGFGVGIQILFVSLGLGALIKQSDEIFFMIQILGAAMVTYLGIKGILDRKKTADSGLERTPSRRRIFGDSVVVGITNAKTLIFFIAVLPSFINPEAGNITLQMLFLGALFLVIGVTSDSAYAIAAGKARDWLSSSADRLATFRGIGGLALTLLGVYMFFDAIN